MPRNKVAWRRFVFVVLIIASLAVLTVSFRETESGPVHTVQQAAAGLQATERAGEFPYQHQFRLREGIHNADAGFRDFKEAHI